MFRWFRRGPQSPFPSDMLERLDRLGRCKMDMVGSGLDWTEVIRNCIMPFHPQAADDPDKFLADLLLVVEREDGGFATYGAASLMYELAGDSRLTENGKALADLGVEFKRRRGLPPATWTGYERERWSEIRER